MDRHEKWGEFFFQTFTPHESGGRWAKIDTVCPFSAVVDHRTGSPKKKNFGKPRFWKKKCDHPQITKRWSRLYVARTFEKEKLIGFPKMDLLQTHASQTIFSHLPYSVKKGGVWGVSPQAHPDGFDGTLLLRSALTCRARYLII